MTPNTADFRIPPLFVSPEIGGIGGGLNCTLIFVSDVHRLCQLQSTDSLLIVHN